MKNHFVDKAPNVFFSTVMAFCNGCIEGSDEMELRSFEMDH